MILVKNMETVRDKNGKIIGYMLQDSKGVVQEWGSDELKYAIKHNNISVVNLQLTSDNRLIARSIDKDQHSDGTVVITKNFIEYMLGQAHILDTSKITIMLVQGNSARVGDGNVLYRDNRGRVTVINNGNTIRITGAKLEVASGTFSNAQLARVMFRGTIGIHGEVLDSLFLNTRINTVDIEKMESLQVKKICNMFKHSTISSLKIGSFNTPNVESFRSNFHTLTTPVVDLSTFKMAPIDMSEAFAYSHIGEIIFGKFNMSRVTTVFSMFSEAHANLVDMNGIQTHNVTCANRLFERCRVKKLDIGGIDLRSVTDGVGMFESARIEKIKAWGVDKVTKNIIKDRLQYRAKPVRY